MQYVSKKHKHLKPVFKNKSPNVNDHRDILVPDAGCEGLTRMAGLKVSVLNNLNMSIHQSLPVKT